MEHTTTLLGTRTNQNYYQTVLVSTNPKTQTNNHIHTYTPMLTQTHTHKKHVPSAIKLKTPSGRAGGWHRQMFDRPPLTPLAKSNNRHPNGVPSRIQPLGEDIDMPKPRTINSTGDTYHSHTTHRPEYIPIKHVFKLDPPAAATKIPSKSCSSRVNTEKTRTICRPVSSQRGSRHAMLYPSTLGLSIFRRTLRKISSTPLAFPELRVTLHPLMSSVTSARSPFRLSMPS